LDYIEPKGKYSRSREVLDAEIANLEKEIVATKTKRQNNLVAKDTEIADLEKEIVALKNKHT
jgi:hypothetical protein